MPAENPEITIEKEKHVVNPRRSSVGSENNLLKILIAYLVVNTQRVHLCSAGTFK